MSVNTITDTSSNVNTITDTSFNAEHTETVNVPVTFLWKILLDKIEHPDRYIPGVSNVKILSHGDHFIERQMSMGKSMLHENITWQDDNYTIKFERHANDPHFTGCVYNLITPDPNGGAPSLTFRFAWHVKSENNDIAQEMITNMSKSNVIQQAVQQTKKLAESDYQAQQKDQIKNVEYKQ